MSLVSSEDTRDVIINNNFEVHGAVCIWTVESLPDWKIIIDIIELYFIADEVLIVGNGLYNDSSVVVDEIQFRGSKLRTVSFQQSAIWIKLEMSGTTKIKLRLRQKKSISGKLLNLLNCSPPNLSEWFRSHHHRIVVLTVV